MFLYDFGDGECAALGEYGALAYELAFGHVGGVGADLSVTDVFYTALLVLGLDLGEFEGAGLAGVVEGSVASGMDEVSAFVVDLCINNICADGGGVWAIGLNE